MIEVNRPGDFLLAYLQDKHGISGNWTIKVWERKNYGKLGERGPNEFLLVTGAEYEAVTRGPRKGQPNWRKPIPGTEMTFPAILSDMSAWERRWELRTGKCKQCIGGGQEWRGWTAGEGDRFDTCRRCGGTGQAKSAA